LTEVHATRTQRGGKTHACNVCNNRCRYGSGDLDQTDDMKPLPTRLTHDEAQFIDAAFARILSGKGATPKTLSRGSDQRTATLYRAGISAVQAYCLRENRLRFQTLATWQQDAVLALLEDGDGRAALGQFKALFFLMVNDAVEVYFDEGWFVQDCGDVSATRPEFLRKQHRIRAADDRELAQPTHIAQSRHQRQCAGDDAPLPARSLPGEQAIHDDGPRSCR
jgi:hypothetical protein